jgi:hypothetical protein
MDDDLDPDLADAQAERNQLLRWLAIGIVLAVGAAGILLAVLWL